MKRMKYKNFEIRSKIVDRTPIQYYIVSDKHSNKYNFSYLSKELKIIPDTDLPSRKKIFELFYFETLEEAKKYIDAYLESKNFIKEEEMKL